MIRAAVAPIAFAVVLLFIVVMAIVVPIAFTLPTPGAAIATFLFGPGGDLRHLGNVVETATPLMFTGLAVSLMFRAGMFNLGAEGAFFLGGVAASYAIIALPPPAWVPDFLVAPWAILFGAVCGSVVCLIPGILRSKFGASELVSSLMLNYAALYLGLYVVNYLIRDPMAGSMVSYKFPAVAKLPRLLTGTRIHAGTIVAILACALGAVWLFRTRWGFSARLVGANARFARHLGLSATLIAAGVQALGGLIAAAGGAIEVQGMYTRFTWDALPGQGWNGLVVAILAGNNPALIPPAAFALSWLQVGGDLLARNFDIPAEVVGVVEALVILLATAGAILRNPKLLRVLRGQRGVPA